IIEDRILSIASEISGQTCRITLHDIETVIKKPIVVTDKEDAFENGMMMAARLLSLTGIQKVIMSQQNGTDILDIELTQGKSWDEVVTRLGQSRHEVIIDRIQKALYENGEKLVPQTTQQYFADNFTSIIQNHLDYLADQQIIKTSKH